MFVQRAVFSLHNSAQGLQALCSTARTGCAAIAAIMIDVAIDRNDVEYIRQGPALEDVVYLGHYETVQ